MLRLDSILDHSAHLPTTRRQHRRKPRRSRDREGFRTVNSVVRSGSIRPKTIAMAAMMPASDDMRWRVFGRALVVVRTGVATGLNGADADAGTGTGAASTA